MVTLTGVHADLNLDGASGVIVLPDPAPAAAVNPFLGQDTISGIMTVDCTASRPNAVPLIADMSEARHLIGMCRVQKQTPSDDYHGVPEDPGTYSPLSIILTSYSAGSDGSGLVQIAPTSRVYRDDASLEFFGTSDVVRQIVPFPRPWLFHYGDGGALEDIGWPMRDLDGEVMEVLPLFKSPMLRGVHYDFINADREASLAEIRALYPHPENIVFTEDFAGGEIISAIALTPAFFENLNAYPGMPYRFAIRLTDCGVPYTTDMTVRIELTGGGAAVPDDGGILQFADLQISQGASVSAAHGLLSHMTGTGGWTLNRG
ncbi:hypothetical protein U5903_04180 [Cereibacter johrii]|uniref:hypothetical protein n=1 Tax=Cereibacter johrii TaxID=445629 RepID=UPI002B25B608|nr:hypothetical protein [Cereibacter johrii]MEA5159966.1 hypothetical protein [Cereibacter johrii]